MNSQYLNAAPLRRRNFQRDFPVRQARKFKLPILLTLAHLPLGVALYGSGALGLIHPLIVFAFGMRLACTAQVKLERVAMVVAYLVGSEIIWRMARLPIFWESGKYAAAAIMIAALVRRNLWHAPLLALFYFLFLLPSCFITLFQFEPSIARNLLSSNMSGPFLLAVSCWFCSHVKTDWTYLKSVLFTMLLPLSSVAATTLFYTLMNANIQFHTESNHATSGDFGPNQVSAMLGLGAFCCFTVLLLFKNRLAEELYLGAFAVFFVAQSVMTFSRGGMYNATGAVLAMILVQMRKPGQSLLRLLPVGAIVLIFLAFVFPYLNDFTGGNLQTRFEDADPTSRGSIVEADLQIFSENPVFGVGVGASFWEYLVKLDRITSSHTEFTRLLAEHGLFGVLALVCLLLMFVHNFRRQTTNAGKALVAGFFAWSSLFMLNAGMRLAAPSFILGLCFLTVSNIQAGVRNSSGGRRKADPRLFYG
jgi:Lipid A core - O-antigen ligase and related enzymes